jgi:hypothetical protein
MAALSPSSVLATPAQINPQVKTDLATSVPQVSQNSQLSVVTAQTDTITISLQALKMSDNKNALAKKTPGKDEARKQQNGDEPTGSELQNAQRNARKAYAKS